MKNKELILDGTKLAWHGERVQQWLNGERIAPITIDMSLTRACNYGYWEVMNYLASPNFDAQKMCGSLCLQHKPNEYLDALQKGLIKLEKPTGQIPNHINFI